MTYQRRDISVDTIRSLSIDNGGFQYQTALNEGIIKNLRYPSSDQQNLNHYMVLFINELEAGNYKGSVGKRLASGEVKRTSGTLDNFKDMQNQASSAVAGAASVVSKDFASEVQQYLQFQEYKRTNVCIALPMPESVSSSYGMSWGEQDLGDSTLLSIADAVSGATGVIDGAKKAAGAYAEQKLWDALSGVIGMGNKSAKNPKKELLFDGNVELRTFTYTWKFFPQNKEDSEAVWSIIQMLKYHALPEINGKAAQWMQFPNLFDIEFFSYNKRNDYLPVTLSCALTNIEVNYTPNGFVSFFEQQNDQSINGSAPSGIELTLSFKETEMLTRNVIDEDKNYTFNTTRAKNGGIY